MCQAMFLMFSLNEDTHLHTILQVFFYIITWIYDLASLPATVTYNFVAKIVVALRSCIIVAQFFVCVVVK